MSDKRLRQPSFIEKRQKWRSSLDKPMGPYLLLTVLPALGLCVFIVLAAPYLHSLVGKLFETPDTDIREIHVSEREEPPPPQMPPPSPESVAALLHQQILEEQGIDWRNPPLIEHEPFEQEAPVFEMPAPQPVEVEMMPMPEIRGDFEGGLLDGFGRNETN